MADLGLPFPPNDDDNERRIAKLAKINAALMQRVERSMDQHANAYSLFQTAISLEGQVRVRTEELKNTLVRLEQANADLTSARDASERANRAKTRFFTSVSHDLLQPLHAARLSLSALVEHEETDKGRRLGDQVDHALSTIEEMLRTILDLSKLEAGVIKPALQQVNLGDIFTSLAVDLEPIARKKGLVFIARRTNLSVTSDPLMLRRILQNLTANAVHYTERGEVLLAARPRGGAVRIEVWDSGPGIAPAERDRIFEEFQRGSSSAGRNGKGFGLGLSIMRRMAETLHHPIGLCSKVGKGTCFSITAPHAGLVAPTERAPAAIAASRQQAYGFDGAMVVMIDNEPAVLEAMQSLLSGWSCSVRAQSKLASLLDAASEPGVRPDILLADYHLDNGECGIDAVDALRRRWGSSLPAIIITADHSAEVTDHVRRAGCELLRKPIKPAELRVLMLHLLH